MPGPEDTEVDKAGRPMILSSTKIQVHRAKLNEYKIQRANLYADMECGESRRTWEMQPGKLGLTVTDVGWACPDHLGQRELAHSAQTIGKARARKMLIRVATAILSTSPDYVSIFLPLPSFCRTP